MFLLNNKINNFKIIGFWSLDLIVFLNVFFLNQKIVTENDISKNNVYEYVLILISLIILLSVSLLYIKYKKVILQSDYKKLLSESYLFYGYFFWFIFTLMLSNQ